MYEMVGDLKYLVTKYSATSCLPHAARRDRSVAIPRSHSNLVKFSSHDSEYDKVIRILKRVKLVGKDRDDYKMDEKDHNCLQRLRERSTNPRADKSRIERTKGGLLSELCSWIFGDAAFQRWRDDENCRLLWIKGDPGKGKTMLLCSIIDHLGPTAKLTNPKANALLSFFLCQGTDSRINNATAVLCGLLYLLAVQQPSVVSHLREEYDHTGEMLFRDANAWDTLSGIISNALRDPKLKTTYLVIDGLDECETGLPMLLDFISENSALGLPVKWILSSRNNPEVERRLRVDQSRERVSLELGKNAAHVAQAVEGYIRRRVSELPSIQDDAGLQGTIRKKMQQKANGTFLWVSLVIEELKGVEGWEVEEVVDEMPGDLKTLYHRTFKQIQQLKRGKPQLCRLVLSTATTAYQPLHVAELAVLSGLPAQISEKPQSATAIVNLCHPFLTIRDNRVYIIHQSAKDFLTETFETSPTGSEDVHHGMFSRSLQLLSQKLTRNIYGLDVLGPIGRVTPPNPDPLIAAGYSCIYWVDHARDAGFDRHAGEFADDGPVYRFLQGAFLYWLEGLSLLGKLPDGTASIQTLSKGLEVRQAPRVVEPVLTDLQSTHDASPKLLLFLKDAERFAVGYRSIIERAPLQLYGAALVFCPTDSEVRKQLWAQRYPAMPTVRGIRESWDSCLQVLEGHTGPVNAVAFSPRSGLLASASGDRTVRLWSGVTGAYKKTLEGHRGYVLAVFFSPDGRLLASASSDRTIRLWDADGGHVAVFEGHTDWVTAVAFSPDGKTLASAACDRTARLWDVATDERHTLEGHDGSVNALAFSPDGALLASASSGGTIRLWVVATRTCKRVLMAPGNMAIAPGNIGMAVAFSPRGNRLASSGGYKGMLLWDLETGDSHVFEGYKGLVNAIAFSADGETLASASSDRTIRLWNCATRRSMRVLEGHGSSVNAIVFASEGNANVIVSASSDRTLRFWDIGGGGVTPHTLELERHSDSVTALAVSSFDKLLASASSDGKIRLWDSETGIYERTLGCSSNSVLAMAFSRNGKILALASESRTMELYLLDGSRRERGTPEGYCGYVSTMDFSPDDHMLATASTDCKIRLWDVGGGVHLKTFEGHGSAMTSISFSSDARTLRGVSEDGRNLTWDIITGGNDDKEPEPSASAPTARIPDQRPDSHDLDST